MSEVEQVRIEGQTQNVRQLFSEMEAYARQRDEHLRLVWEAEHKMVSVKARICESIQRAVSTTSE